MDDKIHGPGHPDPLNGTSGGCTECWGWRAHGLPDSQNVFNPISGLWGQNQKWYFYAFKGILKIREAPCLRMLSNGIQTSFSAIPQMAFCIFQMWLIWSLVSFGGPRWAPTGLELRLPNSRISRHNLYTTEQFLIPDTYTSLSQVYIILSQNLFNIILQKIDEILVNSVHSIASYWILLKLCRFRLMDHLY